MLHHTKKKAKKGMTFLELIVVLGIFGAISATVLFNYSDFSTNVHLQNLAQDIALQIKRAQTDATSGKTPTLSGAQIQNSNVLVPSDWTPSYGVAFNTDTLPNSFIYYFNAGYQDTGFEDFDDMAAGSYASGDCGGVEPQSECLDEISITSGDSIDLICFDYDEAVFANASTVVSCGDISGEEFSTAYISFTRPRGNALIFPEDEGASRLNVLVRLTSRKGGHKYISVWPSGYINVR